MKRSGILMLLLVLLVQAPAVAGARFEFETKDVGKTPPEVARQQVTIDGKKARIDTQLDAAAAPKMSILYLGDRRELLVLDHGKRETMVIDRATVQKLADQLSQMKQQMESAMANLPPAQRAQMEKMMAGRMQGILDAEPPPPLELRKTDERGTTNGHAWVKWEAFQAGEKVAEYLVTDWNAIGTKQELIDLFVEMSEFTREIAESFGSMMVPRENPLQEMAQLEGFPVVTREFLDGKLRRETTITTIEEVEVAPETFDDPGYKRTRLDKQLPDSRRR